MNAIAVHFRLIRGILFTLLLLLSGDLAYSQPALPQRTLTITPTQGINFGRFCVMGAGGTITVGYDGSRTATGGIALVATPSAQPAIFEIKLCQGRVVNITFNSTTILTGSNGGFLTLNLGPTEKGISGAAFATNSDCNFITPLRVGGTLEVPGGVSPGSYTGNFAITFNQQ